MCIRDSEYTGHKVITLPQHNGKLDAAELRALAATFYADDNHDHMVFPGMVYIPCLLYTSYFATVRNGFTFRVQRRA